MPLLAELKESEFSALDEKTVIGQDMYVKDERSGTYKLNMSGDEAGKLAIPLQETVAKLEKNNKDLLDEKVKAIQKVEPFTALGKTAEELSEIIKNGSTADSAEIEAKFQAQIESLKNENAEALKSAQADIEAANKSTESMRMQLQSQMEQTLIADLKAKHGVKGIADDFLKARIKIVPDGENGAYVARVYENGEMAYKAGQPQTPDQLIEAMRANADLKDFFNAGGAAGSGAGGQGAPTGTGVVRAGDAKALAANIEGLASGKVSVV